MGGGRRGDEPGRLRASEGHWVNSVMTAIIRHDYSPIPWLNMSLFILTFESVLYERIRSPYLVMRSNIKSH